MEKWLSWGTNSTACLLGQNKEFELIANAIETAQKEGKLTPKKPGELFFFTNRQSEWPPQTITVPRQLIEKILEKINTIEKHVDAMREKLR
ncbi:MAG: hypothetical protein QXJ53_04225 [Candidatus Bathyarchaeia archaeon]